MESHRPGSENRRYSHVLRTVPILALFAAAVAGCSGGGVSTTPVPGAGATTAPTAAPSGTASASPTASPKATATPTVGAHRESDCSSHNRGDRGVREPDDGRGERERDANARDGRRLVVHSRVRRLRRHDRVSAGQRVGQHHVYEQHDKHR